MPLEKQEEKKSVLQVWKETGSGTAKKVFGITAINDGAQIIKGTIVNNYYKNQIARARKESFEGAVDRLGLTEDDLKANNNGRVIEFWLHTLFAFICLYSFIACLINGSLITSASSLAIFSLCLAVCFRASFRAFQIKNRSLCSAKEWFVRPSEWFPTWMN